ncbi:MAG: Ig-like domain-containing protein [Candidatus Sulfobium sp.]
MKRLLSLIALFILTTALAGCGGGTGSSSQPSGVNAGVPSVIHVLPVQSIIQTNSYIPVKAKVLDGNGNLLPDTTVTFTNLSLVGSLSATTAKTDQLGIATVNLFSTISGFSTIQAEVNTGAGMVRDKRTVFFSDYDITVPLETTTPVLTLDVDGNSNNIFDEPSDYILFETPDDNEVLIRATLTVGGAPVSGSLITFGSDTAEGTFPLGDTAHTDNNGEASVLVKVDPAVLRTFNTVLNITASADDSSGNIIAENIVSLFLDPVLVDTVSVGADPQLVDSGATSKISAQVSTTAGSAAPDGTVVNFTTTNGSVSPFSQTTSGVATATFTAPKLQPGAFNQQATITGSSGGKSGSVTVTIVAPTPTPTPTPAPTPTPTPTPVPALTVVPASQPIVAASGGTATFTIGGGTPPYVVTSSDPLRAYFGTSGTGAANVTNSGDSIDVTVPAGASTGTITITAYDSVGAVKTATIVIQ